MRVSDEERQRTIDELRRHCAAGRLDVDEYADRIEQALSATSLEDLDRARGDLPMLRIADPAGSIGPGHSTGDRGGPWSAASGGLDKSGSLSGRLAATAVVLMTVIVVLAAVVLATVTHWVWAALLIAGWLLGLTQAHVAARRR